MKNTPRYRAALALLQAHDAKAIAEDEAQERRAAFAIAAKEYAATWQGEPHPERLIVDARVIATSRFYPDYDNPADAFEVGFVDKLEPEEEAPRHE